MILIQKKLTIVTFFFGCHMGFCGTIGPLTAEYFGPKEKLYIGAGVGASFDKHTLTTSNTITNFAVKNTTNSSNAVGEVFLGYGYTADNSFYLGGEIGTYFPRRSTTINERLGVSFTNYTFTDNLYIQDYATLDILPGYRVNPNWLIYGRAGLTFSELSLRQPINSAAGTLAFEDSEHRVGGRFGVGLTYKVSQHFAASLDYFYSTYQKFSTNWPLYNINFNDKASSNFVGASIAYTI
ncbi:outer membrane protein [Legionella brunensis]|uniref:OmpA-like transmembrane domain protein n=1 Tax=Legionella brunensis TaxID=29422 RepID=A0A0W0SNR3_9GAMM|nr:outer membrane beta-barrel protein [Legionella brunensis]KTC84892.1 OmpA-like transmembrane domain protein [Legionella brunensis]